MIELLLQAERALSVGLVDRAEGLYRQAADADPRNAIAVVGLARVALERADDAEAYRQARRALSIDPENVAAIRLVARLEEVFGARGQTLPGDDAPTKVSEPGAATPAGQAAAEGPAPASPPGELDAAPASRSESPSPSRLVDRLLRRNRS